MTITKFPRPDWYTEHDDSAWGKIKAAFRRDWQQTEHDFGAKVPDLNQNAGDTVAQATGSRPVPPGNTPTPHSQSPTAQSAGTVFRDEDEPAYRYGYAAYRHHTQTAQDAPDTWEEAQSTFEREWQDKNEWERYQEAIRRGWNYARLERYRSLPR